jgi:hypothetical protein
VGVCLPARNDGKGALWGLFILFYIIFCFFYLRTMLFLLNRHASPTHEDESRDSRDRPVKIVVVENLEHRIRRIDGVMVDMYIQSHTTGVVPVSHQKSTTTH